MLLLFIAVLQVFQTAYGECPDGFSEGIEDIRCYKYHSRVASWYEANHICTAENAWLVSIQSQEVNDWLNNLLDSKGKSADKWIGLINTWNDAEFKWTLGIPVAYTNWQNKAGSSEIDPDNGDPNHPDATDVHCVSLQRNTGQWSDRSCSSDAGYHFVCEMPIAPTSMPTTVPSAAPSGVPTSSPPSFAPATFQPTPRPTLRPTFISTPSPSTPDKLPPALGSKFSTSSSPTVQPTEFSVFTDSTSTASGSLNGGGVAGVVIAALLVGFAVCFGIFFFYTSRNKKERTEEDPDQNPPMYVSHQKSSDSISIKGLNEQNGSEDTEFTLERKMIGRELSGSTAQCSMSYDIFKAEVPIAGTNVNSAGYSTDSIRSVSKTKKKALDPMAQLALHKEKEKQESDKTSGSDV